VRRRRLLIAIVIPIVLLAVGTICFRVIEGPEWTWIDAFYMATITLTTVGFHEVHPLSDAGRVFTSGYALFGIFTLFYLATQLIRFVVSGEIRAGFGKRFMERQLATISDHLIICGYGRMGQQVAREFERRELSYVVIDREPSTWRQTVRPKGLLVHGDATSDEVLKRAGVTRARSLITVVSSDADNLFITMSARLLNPKLLIVARAEDPAAEEKLRRAGANRVVSPYLIGGQRMAHAVLRPTVVDFIDLATRSERAWLQIEEIEVAQGSALAGKTLEACRFRDQNINIVAIRNAKGELVAPPSGQSVIEPGSILIVFGPRPALDELERQAAAVVS
jgi:voltage-gated potassium channel